MERAAEGGIFSREYPMARARTRQRAGPQHAFVRLEKMRFRRSHLVGVLAQRCDVQNPGTAAVSAGDDIARGGMHGDFMHGHGGQIVIQSRPVPAAIHAGERAKLGAAVEQIRIGHILAQAARRASGQVAVERLRLGC